MTLSSLVPLVIAAEATNPLPVPNFVFPLIAASVFTLLGFVAWSYRDVANRHTGKPTRGGDHHGPSV